MIEYTCKECNKKGMEYPSDKKKYCSYPCSYLAARKRKGKLNKQYTKVTKCCLVCKMLFEVNNARKNKAKFCSHTCASAFRNEGRTSVLDALRRSARYKKWRKQVFERDNYTCQDCSQRGGSLQADHIKPFAFYPDLRFELTNGRTLCIDCHRQTPTWGNRKDCVLATTEA